MDEITDKAESEEETKVIKYTAFFILDSLSNFLSVSLSYTQTHIIWPIVYGPPIIISINFKFSSQISILLTLTLLQRLSSRFWRNM